MARGQQSARICRTPALSRYASVQTIADVSWHNHVPRDASGGLDNPPTERTEAIPQPMYNHIRNSFVETPLSYILVRAMRSRKPYSFDILFIRYIVDVYILLLWLDHFISYNI